MKLPKHRANVFIVERTLLDRGISVTCVGVFPTPEGADAFAGACMQEFKERGFTEDDVSFCVKMSTYYDA